MAQEWLGRQGCAGHPENQLGSAKPGALAVDVAPQPVEQRLEIAAGEMPGQIAEFLTGVTVETFGNLAGDMQPLRLNRSQAASIKPTQAPLSPLLIAQTSRA